ncbi:hypothetical protein PIIN_11142 [Serendipita indica DSM 11827]|uniref:Kinesin light chain n=1 Tax=Serendipita indica (strain DSM 11827) TaxID=1109443 RepID=G4U0R7_SERID|nr:hypothetical protein PIIN_11142 [Serendipita indica DSM 11827]
MSTHGAVLITTRNSEYVGYAPDGSVPVGDLEESEAIKLLHTVANVAPQSDAESLKIVKELGMLALAITQAGAYIHKTRRLDTYLDTFRSHRDRLLRKQMSIGNEYISSTYTAFDLSFDFLPAKAQEFLKLCAFLHHSLIPIRLFKESMNSGFTTYTILQSCPPSGSDQDFISSLNQILGSTWDEVVFQDIIESASRASFIEVSIDGMFYAVHPLLQAYIKDHLDEQENQRYASMTMQLLLGAIRPVEGSYAPLWELVPHANNIPRSLQVENLARVLAFNVLYESLGDWTSSRALLEFAVPQLQQAKSERHEDSLWAMLKLSAVLGDCGQLDEAEQMGRGVLALYLETLGGQHPDTVAAMNNLAITLYSRGKLGEAEQMQRDVLPCSSIYLENYIQTPSLR